MPSPYPAYISIILYATCDASTSAAQPPRQAVSNPLSMLMEDRPDALNPSTRSLDLMDARGEKRTMTPAEAAAWYGAKRCFRAWTTPTGLKAMDAPARARLLAMAVQPHPPQEALWEAVEEKRPDEALKRYRSELAMRRVAKLDVLRQLLDLGFDPDLPNAEGLTPLHLAAYWGRSEAAELLLTRGAKLNAVSSRREIPEIREPLHGPATADYYLSCAQAAEVASTNAKTPLVLALRSRLDLRQDMRIAPMSPVSREDQEVTLRILLAHKPNVGSPEAPDMTPLMVAASALFNQGIREELGPEESSFGDARFATDTIQTLLDLGADPGAVANRGYTALAFAARAGLIEAASLLASRTPRTAVTPGKSGVAFDPVHQVQAFALLSRNEALAKALLERPVNAARELPRGVFPEPGQDFDGNGAEGLIGAATLGGPQMVDLLAPHVTVPAGLDPARKTAIQGLIQQRDAGGLRAHAQTHRDPELERMADALALSQALDAYGAKHLQALVRQGARPHPAIPFPWSRLFYMAETGAGEAEGKAVARECLKRFTGWAGRQDLSEVFQQLIQLPAPSSSDVLDLLEAAGFPFQNVGDARERLKARGDQVPKATRQRLEHLLGVADAKLK